jgi:tetratricopeptide (TPR) repeat protein
MSQKPRRKKSSGADEPAAEEPRAERSAPNPRFLLALVALLVLTVTVFAPVVRHGFVSLDDPEYVTGPVKAGLTPSNIASALSGYYWGFYIPATVLSHMADFSIFGEWAGGHHLTSLVIHLANTLLLLAFLVRATKAPWKSLFVAALFAVHPLHVEPVAWIAERKEILCAFFELLALSAYVRYCRRRSVGSYAAVLFAFGAALLSKPMAVTFPFLLLLLDYWPLGRLDVDGDAGRAFKAFCRLALEKLPLFALIPVASWLTLAAQAGIQAAASGDRLPLAHRLSNAGLAYGWYVVKMLFPSRLAAYYPHTQGRFSVPLLALSLSFLVAATAAALWFGRRHRYLPTGWFWFLGTLVPVIGIVQVGLQAWADRYSYVSLIGLFVVVSWGAAEALPLRFRERPWVLGLPASVAILVLAALARSQVMTWSSNEVLYRRILRFSPECPIALVNLGAEFGEQHRFEEAADCFLRASRVTHLPPAPRLNWCFCLSQLERNEEAAACFETALAEDPGADQAHFQLGYALSKLQRHAEAMPHYRKALEAKAVSPAAVVKIGEAYRTSGLPTEAAEVYRMVLAADPGNSAAVAGLAACRATE